MMRTGPLSSVAPLARLVGRSPTPPDALFSHLAEQLLDAVFLVAPRPGKFLYCNGRATELTGWSRADLSELALSELIAPADAPDALQHIHRLEPGMTQTLLNVPLRGHSGRVQIADLRLSALAGDPDVNVLMLASRAEARIAAERASAQSERALQAMDGLAGLLLKPDEGAVDHAVGLTRLLVSGDAAGLYRVVPDAPELWLANGFGLPASLPARLGAEHAEALLTPTFWAFGQRPSGPLSRAARACGWTAIVAHPVGDGEAALGLLFVGFQHDHAPPRHAPTSIAMAAHHLNALIRDLARIEALNTQATSLAEADARLRAVSENIHEAIVQVAGDGRVLQVNRAAEHLLGYRSAELDGLSYDDILVSPQRLGDHIRTALSGQAGAAFNVGQTIMLHRRDGESFPASIKIAPLASSGALILVHDLSAAKAIEARSEQLEQRALLGQMSAIFAHQVRNPLHAISVGVQYVATHLAEDNPLSEELRKIRAECERLSTLMQDVLQFAKPLELDMQPVELGELIGRLLARWGARIARQNVSLHRDFAAGLPPVEGDVRTLEQVFTNLIDNALQAMPAERGGTLSVSIYPAARSPGASVAVRVADTGLGMTPEVQARIFDPFFTTKPHGTGLGLAFARRIVTVHKGNLAVESYPGTGSIFTVTLPIFKE